MRLQARGLGADLGFAYVCVDECAHQANSLSWNPHKMISMPLQASVLLVRLEADTPRSLLLASNGAGRRPSLHTHVATMQRMSPRCNADLHRMLACRLDREARSELGEDYLFHGNPYDVGDKTLQCGRRPDIVKIYLSLVYHGLSVRPRACARVDSVLGARR